MVNEIILFPHSDPEAQPRGGPKADISETFRSSFRGCGGRFQSWNGIVLGWVGGVARTPTWLDPELTGLPGARTAVGIHVSGRVPVLDDQC